MKHQSVNICRPGHGASCALCCGSHNYRASCRDIEELFRRRTDALRAYSREFIVKKMASWRSRMTGSYYSDPLDPLFAVSMPALFQDCPRCPLVTFAAEGNTAGCPLGDEDPSDLSRECFLSYRGKIFTCRAREVLSDAEILYAARYTGDWYYYSVLIHETRLLRGLMADVAVPEEVPEARREALRRELEECIVAHRELHAIHSYFS